MGALLHSKHDDRGSTVNQINIIGSTRDNVTFDYGCFSVFRGETTLQNWSLRTGIALDFSVVPFRSTSMLFSAKNHVKSLKNQWVLTRPDHLNPCLELHAEDKPWPLRGRSLHKGDALRNSHERYATNLLWTKYFHGVSSASPHVYLLQSRYGKVRK